MGSDQSLALDLVDALRLLEAAGLVRTAGVIQADDPVLVRPVTSLVDRIRLLRR